MPPRRILWDFGRREVGHQNKEQGVSGHVQIEIHQAVHQKATTRYKSRKMKRGSKGLVDDEQLL